MSLRTRLADGLGSREEAERGDDAKLLAVPGTVPLGKVVPRARVSVAGVIFSLTRSLPSSPPCLDLTIGDGTDTVNARFLGRREVPGLFPGRAVVLHGVFCSESDGLVVFNPEYELLER